MNAPRLDQTETLFREYAKRHAAILNEIVLERIAQDLKWGEDGDPLAFIWLAAITDSTGQVARAMLDEENLRDKLVSLAAGAVAMVDWLDRGAPHGHEQLA